MVTLRQHCLRMEMCYIGAFERYWPVFPVLLMNIIGTLSSRRPHLPGIVGVTQHQRLGGPGHPRTGQAVGLRLSRSYMAITPAVLSVGAGGLPGVTVGP